VVAPLRSFLYYIYTSDIVYIQNQMRRTGVQPIARIIESLDVIHVAQGDAYAPAFYVSMVQSVDGMEPAFGSDDAQCVGKGHGTSAAVATKTLRAIGIVEDHFEIGLRMLGDGNQTIAADTEFAIAHPNNLFGGPMRRCSPVIHQDEVIAGALVFGKLNRVHERRKVLHNASDCLAYI
jgi:hypothetical protein